ncbi:MAG: hypothetical protein A4E31_00406 [Methanomassiliicoccales archaeon PtaU1.Bin030]|nr:MAG: hypothetical protein A4E31_00406 [Methanomassiliicoccales archaeon PtaU1.Bin030]
MTEEVGLIVKVKTRGAKGELDRIAKDTTKAQNRAVADLQKSVKGLLPKSLRGMFSSVTKGTGGLGQAAVAGGVGGIAAAGVQALIGIGQKMLSFLMQSSASLRNAVRLLNMGFMQIIRPFADTLAMMIRPIALFFRLIGKEIMRRVREKRKELKAQGLRGASLGMALMAEIPGIYLDVFMEFAKKVDWTKILTKIGESVWKFLTEKLPIILEKLRELGVLVLKKIIESIGSMPILATLGLLVLGAIVLAIGTMVVLGTLGALVLGTMTTAIGTMSVLNGLGNSVFSKIMTSIGEMSVLGTLGTAILGIAIAAVATWASSPQAQTDYDRWTGASNTTGQPPLPSEGKANVGFIEVGKPGQGSDANYWKRPLEDVYNMLGGKGPLIPGLATGGEVTATGLVNVHAGEVVKDKGDLLKALRDTIRSEMGSGGFSGNITVNINGDVSRNVQLEQAIRRGIDSYYRERVVNRR